MIKLISKIKIDPEKRHFDYLPEDEKEFVRNGGILIKDVEGFPDQAVIYQKRKESNGTTTD